MRILKFLSLAVALLIALPLVAALFIGNDYQVQRSIAIRASQPAVMAYVRSLRKSNEWNPWAAKDPNMTTTYGGTDGTVGATATWKGNAEVGCGTQTITHISPGRVEARMDFTEPMENSATDRIDVTPSGDGVQVTWTMQGRNPYPFNLIVPFMNNMMGKDFEIGLAKLKTLAEAQGAAVAHPVSQP